MRLHRRLALLGIPSLAAVAIWAGSTSSSATAADPNGGRSTFVDDARDGTTSIPATLTLIQEPTGWRFLSLEP